MEWRAVASCLHSAVIHSGQTQKHSIVSVVTFSGNNSYHFNQLKWLFFSQIWKSSIRWKGLNIKKKKNTHQKSTRVKVFHKGRSLELVKNIGCWALWTSWAEVLAAFYELTPSVETLWDGKESFERAGVVQLWPSLRKACMLSEVLIFWGFCGAALMWSLTGPQKPTVDEGSRWG